MKIQNIFRMQAIVIGFGAALLFASATPAQEIVNTSFDDGPYVTSFAQPTPAATVTASNFKATDSPAVTPVVAVSAPVVTNPSLESFGTTVESGLIAVSLFGLALITLYAVAEVRRAQRNPRTGSPLTNRAALS